MAERHGSILVVDDEADVRTLISAALGEDGHDVVAMASGEEAVPTLSAGDYDVAFIDINLPGMSGFDLLEQHVAAGGRTAIIVITGRATVANAIEATRRGAYDYVTKPFDLDALRLLARQVLERQALQRKLSQAREKTRAEFTPGVEIVGQSAAMQEIYKRIGRVAGTQATVLVEGESGTGKELIAQALHAYSDRWQGPFVAVNCSAIPADLLESEMFGHERGAFTGATDRRIGKFEQAAGGTLFLDEIGELPLALQAKLLRVLQEKEFTRVGGHALVPTDCRIVTATNKQLEREAAAGRFREDLYFRLKVVVLDVPPLRDRREDIPLLVEFFVDRINALHKFDVRGVSPDALSMLATRAWPGNVRELENVLVRAAALAPNRVLTAADFGVTADAGEPADDRPLDESIGIKVRQYIRSLGETLPRDLHTRVIALVERPLIEAVLERTGGNQLRAAEALGINRNTLRKRITDLGIDIPKERG
ncbi:MAG TPA: sigma-54 dependent transcriptional regulator [Candidatus Binatia bacterium]|nr:sigma-54 dependent transcriptional regulator [Candidatus Binatia bacterium]